MDEDDELLSFTVDGDAVADAPREEVRVEWGKLKFRSSEVLLDGVFVVFHEAPPFVPSRSLSLSSGIKTSECGVLGGLLPLRVLCI